MPEDNARLVASFRHPYRALCSYGDETTTYRTGLRIASSDNCSLANILRCVLRRLAMHCKSMDPPYEPELPSPAPWVFESTSTGSHIVYSIVTAA